MDMKHQLLPRDWKMSRRGSGDWLPARVPGSVYGDLLANGRMEDPYYRDNEWRALEIIKDDFEYVTHFSVPEEYLREEKVLLRFEGIDTIADLVLNEVALGHTENMHRTFEFSVKEYLKAEDNELRVVLYSPTGFIKAAYGKCPIEGSSDAMKGFPYLRKAHCMFGWDWGPRLPDAGIWRNVSLLAFSGARFDSVYITQHHQSGSVDLEFQIDLEEAVTGRTFCLEGENRYQTVGGQVVSAADGSWLSAASDENSEYDYRITVVDPDGVCHVYDGSPSRITVEKPQLWWPNGYGKQPLYRIRAELL